MAITISYEQCTRSFTANSSIFRATSGGTVFTSIAYNSTAFDYFDDTSVVDDALYFCVAVNSNMVAGIKFNVGTPIAATSYTLAWEYYGWTTISSVGSWLPIEDLSDDTASFSITGSHIVKFPQQWQPKSFTVNGAGGDRHWVRCRLSAVSGLTEGGANQTDTLKYGNGILTFSGSVLADHFSFTDVYNWIKTNEPHISVTKTKDSVFDFTKVGIIGTSYIETFNETLLFGPNSLNNVSAGYNSFTLLVSGIRKGNRGYNGSVFIIYGSGNSQVFSITGNDSTLYGCTFKAGKTGQSISAWPGYFSVSGTYVDTTFELAPLMSPREITNVKMYGYLMLAGDFSATFTNFTYFLGKGQVQLIYQYGAYTGWTITGFDYNFVESSAVLLYFYTAAYRTSPVFNFINPVTPLGSWVDAIKPVSLYVSSPTAFSNVKKYIASNGTYTNYTTEASDSTVDDVPLGGEVGDMLYFNSSADTNNTNFYLEKTTETNDYVYEWEYYSSGSWISIGNTNKWDGTNNLSKTGYFLSCCYRPQGMSLVTVDGVSSYWYRARIITKGTGNPVATRIRRITASGIGNWTVNQKYSCDLKIVDSNNSAISSVTVSAYYPDGSQIFSTTTDGTGKITQQLILNKKFTLDAEYSSTNFIKETQYPTIILVISKSGYETYTSTISNDGIINTKITLKSTVPIRKDLDGNIFKALQAETGSSAKMLKL
jgi:hypothetical protein